MNAARWENGGAGFRLTLSVVLCGPARHAPDVIVGPFDTADAAEAWAAAHQQEGRYAVAQEVTPPDGV